MSVNLLKDLCSLKGKGLHAFFGLYSRQNDILCIGTSTLAMVYSREIILKGVWRYAIETSKTSRAHILLHILLYNVSVAIYYLQCRF